jgi:hypothetical protein
VRYRREGLEREGRLSSVGVKKARRSEVLEKMDNREWQVVNGEIKKK